MALRVDARRNPPVKAKLGREVSARAADGLRSQSKIAAQEKPQAAGLCYTRPDSEHAVWHGDMSLKKASGKRGHLVPSFRHMIKRPNSDFCLNIFIYTLNKIKS